MRTRWTLVGIFFLLLGCDPAPSSPCGASGEYTEDGIGRYCAYAVIEGGFQCPAALPVRFEFGDEGALEAIICTDREIPPEDLPSATCAQAGFECGEGRRVDDEPDPMDGGMADGGVVVPPAACDSADAVVVDATTVLTIDTRSAMNRVVSLCDESAPGSDAFVGLDVAAGDVWHVHASLDPTEAGARDPQLAVLNSACDPRACLDTSAACEGSGDEHLDLVARETGRLWIGIDDALTGGGLYRVSFTRNVCGDDERTHGEACEDGNTASGDGCDSRCRVEITTSEVEPNDSAASANVIALDAPIDGTIGGLGTCTYGDYYVLEHAGGPISVDVFRTDGTACASAADAPFALALTDAGGGGLSDMTDANGCPIIRGDVPAGEYLLHVSIDAELAIPAAYQLRVTAP
jgi:cysteine-rich repeat protein